MSDASKPNSRNWLNLSLLALFSGAIVAGYMTRAESEQAAATPPPPSVDVITVEPQSVRMWTNFSGRLRAVDIAEIKPLVGGELQKVLFEDGQLVKKDDTLFVIDPRPYQAAVKRAEAQLTSMRSQAKLAKDELQRTEKLVKNKLVSESNFDTATNAYAVANAAIHEAESALVEAKLNLNYCYIKAPFDGRVSRAELTVGNIIEINTGAPLLTTLVANDKLYAEFDVDEQTYIKSVRRQQNHDVNMPVQMTLAADPSVVYDGEIYSFDNQLDVASGTIRARAIFDNKDGALTPGMYANVRLGQANEQEALLVPDRAIGTNQDMKFVYVVNADNQAVYRRVELGGHYKSQRVVLSGVEAGEQVIVNGLSHVRPNSPVTPKAVESEQAPVALAD